MLFYSRALFLGENEDQLIAECKAWCSSFRVFRKCFSKVSYRDRPDGLIAIAPIVEKKLEDLKLSEILSFWVAGAS